MIRIISFPLALSLRDRVSASNSLDKFLLETWLNIVWQFRFPSHVMDGLDEYISPNVEIRRTFEIAVKFLPD